MNKHLHRVVFNAARGMRMVVQETARSAGKATGATSALLATALTGLLAASSVAAQIVGAPGAAPGLRPTVLLAPNGVPLVNIQMPSAAGVSRNLYNQFDVQPQGVILNNSRTDVQTQLGGWVQANPFLATGPARIILNEVVSGNPTQLRGAIEVGGQRAEVIVANPSGIAVDGATFINASRATLITGTPQLNALGGLEGYVVRGGTVSIDGAGLDARSTDYAAILARAIKVNAALWANELKVVTGANQVSADQGQSARPPARARRPSSRSISPISAACTPARSPSSARSMASARAMRARSWRRTARVRSPARASSSSPRTGGWRTSGPSRPHAVPPSRRRASPTAGASRAAASSRSPPRGCWAIPAAHWKRRAFSSPAAATSTTAAARCARPVVSA
ncbi:filamentous hemagglutinin N-terminal domain-containing protein [Variovorax sp. B2]|uniref:two-partner secretion domain-containing protein n=2 Tax=unclassified Variovorax TaxID=663243 RepID=UPI001F4DFFA2|nr:filamentous hemagglutinin N-terminal domain-containing protein [Variovorax sp. B2]